MCCGPSVACVKPKNQSTAKADVVNHYLEPFRVGNRARSKNKSLRADGQQIFHHLFAADSSAEFDIHLGGFDNLLDDFQIHRTPVARSIKVYNVKPAATRVGKTFSQVDGVHIVSGLVHVIAPEQTDDFSAAQVDCRYKFNSHRSVSIIWRNYAISPGLKTGFFPGETASPLRYFC